MKVNGAFIIGACDSMTNKNAEGFIRKINSYCKNPKKNRIVVVPNASHIYYAKHNEHACAVLDCVKSFECITI